MPIRGELVEDEIELGDGREVQLSQDPEAHSLRITLQHKIQAADGAVGTSLRRF
jgi:hypothetical protein